MKKFNKFDQYVIEQALELWIENFEKKIEVGDINNGDLLFTSGYPLLISKDIQYKVDLLTKKK